MRWLRLWTDIIDDPKVQNLPPGLFKFWINLLCLARQNDVDGVIPSDKEIAFRLRMRSDRCQQYVRALHSRGLIDVTDDTRSPHNWGQRQFKSDDSTPRVQRFRNEQETPPEYRVQNRTEQIQIQTVDLDRSVEKSNKKRISRMAAAPPKKETSPIKSSYTSQKVNDQVAALIDIGRMHNVELNGGRLGAMLRQQQRLKYPKQTLLLALQDALGRNVAAVEDYMQGELRRYPERGGSRNAKGGRGTSRPSQGVATPEDIRRAKAGEW